MFLYFVVFAYFETGKYHEIMIYHKAAGVAEACNSKVVSFD